MQELALRFRSVAMAGLMLRMDSQVAAVLELETKVHPKVRNHGEGPY